MSDNKIKLVSVAGPTASGKTSLSVSLAMRFGAEIVSADSMQIYKGMNIATAKPSKDEMCSIPHHLMDYVDVDETYSVARYIEDANSAINDIMSRGKLPMVVGGTGLYMDSLLSGITYCEGDVDLKLRANLQDKLSRIGIDAMLAELADFDPDSAQRLSTERNPKRIIRAMEVYYTTGITMTEQNLRSKEKESPYNPTKIALNFHDRQKLYDRINRRVDIMLEQGLVKEAEAYFSANPGNTAVQAIGYKELRPYFDGELSLDECVEILKRSTRRYAKRQLTWFMRDPQIKWFYADDFNDSDELFRVVSDYLIQEGFEAK
ncbi:MAG: tRNA (adenosine(37)-N6)-dimethylallyltransferase MiaA [Ruminococcus sp.]|nr:tRNA (adenosine(37)-N6)-dimethylallyltransferase MiaA [Ruminococcus sp.]